ncbi:pyridoxamine 5'-phosphate oxidase family protein [Serratia marcescens]|uniref:Pyridoxamine 5'-phosphate oxidase family protein n=1 Tax=Serratia marcescens TaxID=615 RepID=A0ABX5NFT1_SERMA|nr:MULTISPECIES: pyridoxamine 5'-phosphate oxidase family protein [Serratia]AUY16951.1 pyridoxamine 5'-phosphate oxidase family protein [Serratia sp. SSNIH1]EJC0201562.1 pyridoxamine 5'-phosphate oxidase family protein [Serratia marcescens]EMB4110648.1 pyridoxamine 5'-phosphate oxidase family protein [Serratia marcescens]MBX9280487.1 pyridoxamine 5'-phosphate oxidase family protein [Serratia marcescens]MBX9286239.1 pyridoxamine 5'-phosphate oxidase family protein [Serratia marcescens]
MSLVERSLYLLQNTRFFTLASRSLVGDVWASTVSYVAAFEPIRIIWCSDRLSKHSENIREHAQVSGAIFRADLQGVSPLGLDGAQFVGFCHEVPESESVEVYSYFSSTQFPDEALRVAMMPPFEEFTGNGTRRFYELRITEWWLLDIDLWLEKRQDRRISLDISLIAAPL